LAQNVVPSCDVEIGQGIYGKHPAKLVQLARFGPQLFGRGRAVQQLALLGYKFGYFRKKKLAMGTASVTGMLIICSW
jgi:hypothetical protein